ncbi:MAG: isoprenyl transferase [Candidatus Kapaibacteriales bacterium]
MSWSNEKSAEEAELIKDLQSQGKLPVHVAVIMDGNGRWATNKAFPRLNGHREGIESVRDIVKSCSNIGVKHLTLYAFSIENWNRPEAEVIGLMKLLEKFLLGEIDELDENNVRLNMIGKSSSLPKNIQKILSDCTERTKDNTGLTLTLAISYSGRWDITRAMQMMALDVRRGSLSPEDVTEDTISGYLSTKGIPDPDLLIRTSGELRISNFLLWELAYSEIYVSEVLWPDFRKNDFYNALYDYQKRERRFGKTSHQLLNEKGADSNNDSYIQRMVNAIRNK